MAIGQVRKKVADINQKLVSIISEHFTISFRNFIISIYRAREEMGN